MPRFITGFFVGIAQAALIYILLFWSFDPIIDVMNLIIAISFGFSFFVLGFEYIRAKKDDIPFADGLLSALIVMFLLSAVAFFLIFNYLN